MKLVHERDSEWLSSGTLLRRMRRMFPSRLMDRREAMVIAERQAALLLGVTGIEAAPVPVEVVGHLSSIEVQQCGRMPVAGVSLWNAENWIVAVDTAQCDQHQRTTLVHELKHVVDHSTSRRYIDDDIAEDVADYFARCVLLPRSWVKTAIATGESSMPSLVELFDVPYRVMVVRLHELGLLDAVSKPLLFSVRRRSRCRRQGCPR